MDIFKIGNDYYISEVNPRFGGAILMPMSAAYKHRR